MKEHKTFLVAEEEDGYILVPGDSMMAMIVAIMFLLLVLSFGVGFCVGHIAAAGI